jgi:ribulose-phosphate 3-epimerase
VTTVRIAPSILAANFAALGDAIACVERAGADLIHVDVMDGHFVPNITIGPPVVRSLKKIAKLPLDVHLMISDPNRYIEDFAAAGAAMMSIHPEAVLPHLHGTVHAIKALGVKAGVAINPATPLSLIEDIAADLDYLLIMSVNPGFGGQVFIPRSEHKLREARALLDRVGNPALIEIDGGIDMKNVAQVVAAGARILVAGSAVFHAPDPERAVHELRTAALSGLDTSPAQSPRQVPQ